jgi:hypothetical protein
VTRRCRELVSGGQEGRPEAVERNRGDVHLIRPLPGPTLTVALLDGTPCRCGRRQRPRPRQKNGGRLADLTGKVGTSPLGNRSSPVPTWSGCRDLNPGPLDPQVVTAVMAYPDLCRIVRLSRGYSCWSCRDVMASITLSGPACDHPVITEAAPHRPVRAPCRPGAGNGASELSAVQTKASLPRPTVDAWITTQTHSPVLRSTASG